MSPSILDHTINIARELAKGFKMDMSPIVDTARHRNKSLKGWKRSSMIPVARAPNIQHREVALKALDNSSGVTSSLLHRSGKVGPNKELEIPWNVLIHKI